MKKLFSLLSLSLGLLSFAQVNHLQEPPQNRWTVGGGLGFGFGSNSYFDIQISPRVGYRLTEDLEAGLMGNFTLQSSRYYKSTMVGVGPFANYYLGRSFYLSSSFQHYFVNYKDKYTGYKADTEESALYLGGGYMQKIGTGAYFQVGLMYNVLWKEHNSIFSSGLVPNIGFVVGL